MLQTNTNSIQTKQDSLGKMHWHYDYDYYDEYNDDNILQTIMGTYSINRLIILIINANNNYLS